MLYTVSRKQHCFGLLYLRRASTNFNNLLWTVRAYYYVQCANIISRLAVSFSRHGIQRNWKDTISRVCVSPGSAETLVRRGGITNHTFFLIAYFLSNISNIICYVILYLIIWMIPPYCLQKIIKIGWCVSKIYQAKAVSFSRHGMQHDWKDNFRGSCVEVIVCNIRHFIWDTV